MGTDAPRGGVEAPARHATAVIGQGQWSRLRGPSESAGRPGGYGGHGGLMVVTRGHGRLPKAAGRLRGGRGGRREPIREVAHCRRGASEAAGSRWEALVTCRKSAREAKGRPS